MAIIKDDIYAGVVWFNPVKVLIFKKSKKKRKEKNLKRKGFIQVVEKVL